MISLRTEQQGLRLSVGLSRKNVSVQLNSRFARFGFAKQKSRLSTAFLTSLAAHPAKRQKTF
jgi:hypothetical protein